MAALAAFFSDPLGQLFPGAFVDYLAVRLFGKKELAQLSVTDLVFIL